MEDFYNSYVQHFETDDDGLNELIDAIKTGDYAKVHSTMLSAYLLWLDASKSKN
jgi:hypothetical protein